MTQKDSYRIDYVFKLPDGRERKYEVFLDPETISYIPKTGGDPPEWTELERQKCTVCPLNADENTNCPIAVNLSEMIDHFKDERSTTIVSVTVVTPERSYVRKCSVQEGLFSIFGIIMATSNCPVMNFLKPMARFHLPFATVEETIVRSTSMYLLRQYFVMKQGHKPDIDLKGLDKKYSMIKQVNQGFANRMSSIVKEGDADRNAVSILDAFAQMLTMEIGDNLSQISYLFQED